MITTLTKKINMITYFKNLTVGFHVLYDLINMDVKFCANRILFIIQSINLILCIIL